MVGVYVGIIFINLGFFVFGTFSLVFSSFLKLNVWIIVFMSNLSLFVWMWYVVVMLFILDLNCWCILFVLFVKFAYRLILRVIFRNKDEISLL